ncbi:unnamed protein product [Paramecium octaurelia]|uniref:Uncharacterized protein n=1 Tax=Paramecium octaurelia TaxID=43137 RepID=A0A8S1W3P0_PAROT|nr:unnamed protein product [Paramecium octaurelia]
MVLMFVLQSLRLITKGQQIQNVVKENAERIRNPLQVKDAKTLEFQMMFNLKRFMLGSLITLIAQKKILLQESKCMQSLNQQKA